MYAQHWGLVDVPFQSAIDRRWFYEGPSHEEALARLLFLVEQHRRCGLLSSDPGMGKSMLLALLKRAVEQAQGEVARIDLAGRTSEEVVFDLATGLKMNPQYHSSPARWWRDIEDALIGNHLARRQTLLLFDHFDSADRAAQSIVARLIRLDAETPSWTTIIVAAREEFVPACCDVFLDLIDLKVHIPQFTRDESRDYVISLLGKAGRREPLFTDSALDRLHELSGGVPRQINRLCDLSLLSAMSAGVTAVTAEIVAEVADDREASQSRSRLTPALAGHG